MTTLRPSSIAEALQLRAAHPDAVVVAGGTGVLLDLNRGAAPSALLDLSRVAGARAVERSDDAIRLGAGVTYTQVLEELADALPGLALAARTVASRQVRNRATLAGALVLADPSGDALAALGAADAVVEVASADGSAREVPAAAFVRGVGECALALGELVVGLRVPPSDGPVAYAKLGDRNAMARAVCAVAVALHPERRTAAICVVGAAPTAVRATDAEALVAASWDAGPDLPEVAALVAAAVAPIPDPRGSEAYRRHVAGVLARRALARAWGELS